MIKIIEEENEETKPTFIPLTFDFMFKSLFATERNMKILTALLSDYTNKPYKDLEGKIRILNSELIKNHFKEKGKRVDTLIEVDNVLYNLEMNTSYYNGLLERNTSYISKVYSEHQITKETYVDTKKCIQINFNLFKVKRSNNLRDIYKIRNNKNKELTENIEIHHVNIQRDENICYNKDTEEKIYKWGKVLTSTNMEELERNVKFMGELGKEFVSEVDRLNSDEFIIGLYDGELHDKKVKEQMRRDAIEEGLKEGLKKGKLEGIKLGIKDTNIDNAKKMLNKNCDVEFISDITGLSVKFINKLKVSKA